MISGALPEDLPVQLAAEYAASHPKTGEGDYAECYRQGLPPRNLHLTEPLQLVRRASRYEAWVTVDKYQPGHCGWGLVYVGYQVLNTMEYQQRANVTGSRAGEGIISTIDTSPPGQMPWQGQINVWCLYNRDRAARDKDFPEECGRFSEVVGDDVPGVPASERNAERATWLSPETRSVTVNFHDLDAERTAADARD
jgi:hypothetical protein